MRSYLARNHLRNKNKFMKQDLIYPPFLSQLRERKKRKTDECLNEFLQNLYFVIENNIDDSFLNVGFLAKNMAMSRSTLNRKLSNLTGLSANEIIKQRRLQKAILFLGEGKNVSETAYLTGFETPSYFIQCFKDLYKLTPKAFSKCNNSFIYLNNAQNVQVSDPSTSSG